MSVSTYKNHNLNSFIKVLHEVPSGIVKIREEQEKQTWVNEMQIRLVGRSNENNDAHLFPATQSVIFNIKIFFFTMYTYNRQKRNINSAEKDEPPV